MSYTKNRDWDMQTDGEYPVVSTRHKTKNPIVLDGTDGTFFGWEAEDGELFVGTRLTFDAAAQAERDAAATALSDWAAELTARAVLWTSLKNQRETGGSLNNNELNDLADLILGVNLT